MDIIIISSVALITSLLTFFSGFGLGTILMPVFAIFFPLEAAIAMTGIVHFISNISKVILVGRNANKKVLLHFGLPAILTSFLGAYLLLQLSSMHEIFSFSVAGHSFKISLINLIIGIILIFFSLMEIVPCLKKIEFGNDKLIIGGLLSGFFGGLSGIQGALRSAFLIKSGLNKEAYIATGVAIAVLVDFSRLSIYLSRAKDANILENIDLMIYAASAAIIGTIAGKRLLKKLAYSSIQVLVAIMLIIISICLILGII